MDTETAPDLMKNYEELLRDCADVRSAGGRVSRMRDLTLIDLIGDVIAVIACDSDASIGKNPMDDFKTSYEELGIFMIKVPLLEIISCGAIPALVVSHLCVGSQIGEPILTVIKNELRKSGFDPEIQLFAGTDERVKAVQTGSGTTIVAFATRSMLRFGKSQPGDVLCTVGMPKSNTFTKYSEYDWDVVKIDTVLKLSKLPCIREILPCGSHGIAYEAAELAKGIGCEFVENGDNPIGKLMKLSCGASSTVIVSLSPASLPDLYQCEKILPIHVIGTLGKRG